MDPSEAIGYITYKMRQRVDDKVFQRWVTGGYDREMSLDEFKAKLTPHKVRSDEEILDEVYEIFEKAGIK